MVSSAKETFDQANEELMQALSSRAKNLAKGG